MVYPFVHAAFFTRSFMARKKKVLREYNVCKCLVTNIQSVTGHKTHEILSYMHSLAENCIKENGLRVDKYEEVPYYEPTIIDYSYYPNTKIYLAVSINRISNLIEEDNSDDLVQCMYVDYKFYTPSSIKKLTQEQFDDIVIDAMLTDFSMDFDPPAIKKRKTLVQLKKEEKEREAKEKVRQINYLKKELKSLLRQTLEYKANAVDDSSTKSTRNYYVRQFKKSEREINYVINQLKNLGDKTHEVLLTPTDFNNNQTEGKCQTKVKLKL